MIKPLETNDVEFAAFVKQHPNVIMDFWAPWCPPCLRIEPMLDELASEWSGRVTVGKLNADENPETMTRFGVMSLPTLLLIKDGKVVDRVVGAPPKDMLKARAARAFGI